MTSPDTVWVTHPDLTPAHDFECLREALGGWAASGWRERDDQSDVATEDASVSTRPVEPPRAERVQQATPAPRKES